MARWDKIQTKGKIDDRRGLANSIGGVSVVGLAIVLAVAYFGGGEQASQVMEVLQEVNQGAISNTQQPAEFAGEDEYEVFASQVLGVGNNVWKKIAKGQGVVYREPTIVLFRGQTNSACGGARSTMGPHYCPLDETIYLDETFFDKLVAQFGARGGDVAEAYVIAHEIGHHAQNVLGTMDKVRASQAKSPSKANELSIKQELQADCFAGIWAHSLKDKDVFEEGEFVEAMDAAETVGDDHIQEKMNGRVNPESWTHGSSAERKKWLSRGYQSGKFSDCDTFVN